jgi:hypothetical protein
MKFFILFALLAGCSHLSKPQMPESLKKDLALEGWRENEKTFRDSSSANHRIERKEKYWEVPSAKSVAREATGLTLAAWVKVSGKVTTVQDLIALSIESNTPTRSSRASLRLHADATVVKVARSYDQEEGYLFISQEKIPTESWALVMTVINYQQNSVESYLNGEKLTLDKKAKFKNRLTPASDSRTVTIGAEDDGSDFFLQDPMQMVMVWKRALSADDAKLLFESQKAAFKLP